MATSLIVAGVALVGSVYSANKQEKIADRAQKAADRRAAQELAFAKEQYEDWEQIFGPIQENLADYYQNMDADTIAIRGLEDLAIEKEQALTRVRETLAQRGIDSSGLAAETELQVELGTASERAKIRADAPMQVAREQTNFLSVGLGNPNSGLVADALSNQTNMATNNATYQRQVANQASADAADAFGNFATTALDEFMSADLKYDNAASGYYFKGDPFADI